MSQRRDHTYLLASGEVEILVIDAKMATERVDISLARVSPNESCIFPQDCTFVDGLRPHISASARGCRVLGIKTNL